MVRIVNGNSDRPYSPRLMHKNENKYLLSVVLSSTWAELSLNLDLSMTWTGLSFEGWLDVKRKIDPVNKIR